MLLGVDSRGAQSVTRMELTGSQIVGVSATANPGEFAVLNDCGKMTLFRNSR